MRRFFIGSLLAASLLACSSASPTPTPAGATPAPGITAAPNSGPTAAPAGDNQALARALVPAGASNVTEASVGNMRQIYATSSQTIEQLQAFWEQAIPANGMVIGGSFPSAGTLTIAFTNPDGGIVAAPDPSGGISIVISVGTSQ
jgi:hypothetical protein